MALHRYENNPIITVDNIKPSLPDLIVAGVFNPGATRFGNEVILLLRVAEWCRQESGWVQIPVARIEDGQSQVEIRRWRKDAHTCNLSDSREYWIDGKMYLSSLSHLRLARSIDGIHFRVDETPFMLPARSDELYGVEDARICNIDNQYYITYTAVSEDGYGVCLATTHDWLQVRRLGMILPAQNKNAVFFSEKINDKYWLLHRPLVEFLGKPSIWLAKSHDGLFWGEHRCLMTPRDNPWESQKIGVGPEPIQTEAGWLILYHGCGKNGYSLHLALLDLENPNRVLARTEYPVFKPDMAYEQTGFFPNVVFCNGWVRFADNRLLIYYGAADSSVCVAETRVETLLSML